MSRAYRAQPPRAAIALLATLLIAPSASAQIRVGISSAKSGSLAIIGGPERWPQSIAGEQVLLTQVDDAGDPRLATRGARDLAGKYSVDVLIGSSTPGTTLALAEVAAASGLPHLPLYPPAVEPGSSSLPAVVFGRMQAGRIVTVGYIGLTEPWGDLWLWELQGTGARLSLRPVAAERYGLEDTDVAVQAGRVAAANPDAVLIGAYGAASIAPHLALRGLGYAGPIYHAHDTATVGFLARAGAVAQPTFLPASLAILSQIRFKQLSTGFPPSSAQRASAVEALQRLVPAALQAGRPGSKEFRAALAAAIAKERDAAPRDASDREARSWALVTVKDGDWVLAK